MPDKPVFLTPEGLTKIETELEHLRTARRAEVQERIRAAKEFSDTTDNAEFEEAKNEQAFVEGRILTLERMLANVVMIDGDHSGHRDAVTFGSRVTVSDEEGESSEYTIVGSAEASPAHGKISNESPVGSAIMGRRRGDTVEVLTPGGTFKLKIVKID
jgi:transcription elongation factor GreA